MTLAPKQERYLVRPLYPEVLFGGSRRHTTPCEFQTNLSAQAFRSTCYENQLYFNTLSDLTLLRVFRCRAGPVEGGGSHLVSHVESFNVHSQHSSAHCSPLDGK